MEGGNGTLNNVENRVVEMKFDNAQFETAVAKTMQTLDNFKEKLNFEDSGKGLDKLSKSTNNYSGVLSSVGSAIDTLKEHFGSLSGVGEKAFNALTHAATGFITGGINKLTSDIVQGGQSRAMNLEQAKFQLQGILQDANEVNRVIYDDILPQLQGTPFSLDQAAVVMGQLAASGKKESGEVQQATRAIAGAAAMTNSSFADMGRIFTKVAGNGRVMGDTLQEMSSRGLNAAADIGKVFDMTEAEVREAVTAGEISYDMFAQAMDQLYGEQATKSTTMYTGALEDLRAALARIGAEPQAVKLEFLRDAFNALVPAVDAVNSVLKPWINSAHEVEEYLDEDGNAATRYAKAFKGPLAQGIQQTGWAFQSLFVQLDDNHDILRYSSKNWEELGLQMEKAEDGTVSYYETLADGRKVYHDFGEAVMNPDMYRIMTAAAQSFVNVIAALGKLLGAIGKGIIEAFPKLALSNIADLVEGVQKFTQAFVFSKPVLKSIQAIVRALFTPLGLLTRVLIIAGKVIVEVVTMAYRVVKPFVKVLLSSAGLAADVFSGLGSLIDDAAQNVTWFAENLYNGLKAIAEFLKIDVIFTKIRGAIDNFSATLQGSGEKIYNFLTSIPDRMHAFGQSLYALLRLDKVAEAIGYLKERFHELMVVTGHLGFDKLANGFRAVVGYITSLFNAFKGNLNIGNLIKDFGVQLAAMVPTEKIVEGIGRFTDFIIRLGTAIANYIGPYITVAVAAMFRFGIAVGELVKKIAATGSIQAFIKLLGDGFRAIAAYIPRLMGFASFGDMLDALKVKILGFVDVFKEFLAAIIGSGKSTAKNFGKSIADGFAGIGDSKMVKRLSGFGDIVKKLGVALGGAAGGIGDKLKAFYKSLDEGDKKKIVASLSLLAMAFSYIREIARLRNTFHKAEETVSAFKGLGELLTGAGSAFKSAARTVKAVSLMIGLTTSLLILAAAMTVLSRMDMEGLIQGGIAAIGALIALSITLAILKHVAKDEDGKTAEQVIKMGLTMAAVGAAVLMITTSMEKIAAIYDSHTPKQFLAILGTLGGMMLAIGLLAYEFSKLDKMEANLKSAGFSMLAIATAVKVMTNAIAAIGSEDPTVLIKGGIIVGGLLVLMGILAKLTATSQGFGDFGSGVLKIAAALLVLKIAIDLYAGMDPITFAVGLLKLGIALVTLLGIFSLFGQIAGPKNAGGLLVATIAVIALAGALMILAAIPFMSLIKGVAGLAIALVVIGAALAILSAIGVQMAIAAGALALLGLTFLAIGAGAFFLTTALATLVPLLLLLSNVDTKMLGEGLGVIKQIAEALASAFLSLALGILAFGAALLVAAVAVVVLAVGVIALGAGFAICGVGLLLFAGGLATIALVIDSFFGGELLNKIGEAFTNLGGLISGGIGKLISGAKKLFKGKGEEIANDFMGEGGETVENDTSLTNAFSNKAEEAVGAWGDVKGNFLKEIEGFMTEGGDVIHSNSGDITGAMDDVGIDLNSVIGGDVSDAANLFGQLPGKAGSEVTKNKSELTNPLKKLFGGKDIMPTKDIEKVTADSGKKMPKAYGDSIAKNKSQAVKAAKDMNTDIQKPYKNTYKDFSGYGKDAANGYKAGINSMVSQVAKAAADMVNTAERAAKNAQDSHSPSKVFAKFGRWADEGYIIGIKSLTGKVSDAASGMVSGGIDAVADAMSAIADVTAMDLDFNPTITPVVDLSEVRQGAKGIDAMLGGSFGLSTPYSGYYNAQMAAAAFQNGATPAEVEAINKLAKEIGTMNDTMNSRQLVNNIHIEGSEDPDAFADRLTRRFRLNARTI